jgi:hypothetical protein
MAVGSSSAVIRAPRVMVVARRHASLLAEHGVEVVFVGTAPLDQDGVTTVGVNAIDPMPLHPKGTLATAIVYLVNEGCHTLQAALAGSKIQRRSPVDLSISHSSLTTVLLKLLSGHRPIVHYTHDGLYSSENVDHGNKSLIRYLVNNLLEKVALRAARSSVLPIESPPKRIRWASRPTN